MDRRAGRFIRFVFDDADFDPSLVRRTRIITSSGNVALMLDPGNNDGAAISTPSGLAFANWPHRHAR